MLRYFFTFWSFRSKHWFKHGLFSCSSCANKHQRMSLLSNRITFNFSADSVAAGQSESCSLICTAITNNVKTVKKINFSSDLCDFHVYLLLHLQVFAYFTWIYFLQGQIQISGSNKYLCGREDYRNILLLKLS